MLQQCLHRDLCRYRPARLRMHEPGTPQHRAGDRTGLSGAGIDEQQLLFDPDPALIHQAQYVAAPALPRQQPVESGSTTVLLQPAAESAHHEVDSEVEVGGHVAVAADHHGGPHEMLRGLRGQQ